MIWRLFIGVVVAFSTVATASTDAVAQFRPGNYGNDPVANFFGFGGGSSVGSPIARTTVSFPDNYRPGTIVIRSGERRLYLVLGNGQALRYGIGVGRDGFGWSGVKHISAKREWPAWTPPAQMLRRRPDLPRHMAGGLDNPLGARAQPARRTRALSRLLALSHPRLERARDDWTGGVVRLLPAHQRRCHRPLRAGAGGRDGDRAAVGLRPGGWISARSLTTLAA